jgi:carbamoyltransferase
VLDILSYAQKITGSKNVVLAGGVALNSVCNGKIISGTPFEHVWIQPNASDGGTSLGAALFAYHSLLGNKRLAPRHHAYFGPSYSDKEIESFLQSQHISYTKVSSPEELVRQSAKLITNNNVVGWFQGGMEWGPRALGARSILANPQNPDAQRLLNEKVKHRELFRPFAPVVCADDAPKYFDMDIPVPEPTDFMLMVYPIRREWQSKIPAVTHVDGSGRLQTIHRSQNALYFDLIKAVGAQSGIPILINTSFNIRGEPIVCTPHDAYRCMMGTGIDYLVMGSYIIKRADNLKDEWDSELLAHD